MTVSEEIKHYMNGIELEAIVRLCLLNRKFISKYEFIKAVNAISNGFSVKNPELSYVIQTGVVPEINLVDMFELTRRYIENFSENDVFYQENEYNKAQWYSVFHNSGFFRALDMKTDVSYPVFSSLADEEKLNLSNIVEKVLVKSDRGREREFLSYMPTLLSEINNLSSSLSKLEKFGITDEVFLSEFLMKSGLLNSMNNVYESTYDEVNSDLYPNYTPKFIVPEWGFKDSQVLVKQKKI